MYASGLETFGKRNERLRTAVNSLQEGFALLDAEGRLVTCNEYYRRTNPDSVKILERGGTFEDLIRANVEQGRIPEAVGREEAFLRERMERHRNPKGPFVRRFSDGKWCLINETRTPDGGVAITFSDITEQKKTQDALHESEERFRSVVDTSPAGVTVKDTDGRYLVVNQTFATWMGLKPSDLIGKTPYEFYPKEQAEAGMAHDRQVFKTGQTLITTDPRIYNDGIPRTIRTYKAPIRSKDGDIIAVSTILTDITESIDTQDALRKNEALFQAVLDHTPAKIHIKDTQGRYTLINKEARKLFGIPETDGRGQTSHDLFPQDMAETFTRHDRMVMETGQPQEGEEVFFLENEEHTYLTVKFPIYDRDGVSGVGAIGTDITERKKADARIRSQALFAEQNPGPVMRLNRDGTVAFANPASVPLLQLWGCKIGEKPPADILDTAAHVLDRQKFQMLERAVGETVFALTFTPLPETHQVNIYGMDITERIQSEVELRVSEERFRAVIDSTPSAIVIKDLNTRCLIANKTFCDWFATPSERMIGTATPDKLDAASRDRILAHDRMVMETGEVLDEERRVTYPDGITRDVNVQKFPIRDADGAIVAIGTVINDISLRQKAEQASRRLSAAIEGLSEAFALYDASERLILCNKEYKVINEKIPETTQPGVTFEEHLSALVGKGLIEEARGREEEWVKNRMKRFRNPGEPFEMVNRDDRILLIRDQRMADGSTAIITSDITAYKKSETLNTRMGRIIDRSINEIFTFDAKTLRFTQANQGALNNTGYSMDELREMTPVDIKPNYTIEQFADMVRPLRDGIQDRIVFETVHRRKDGSTYDVEIHLQLMQAEDPAVFVAIVQDITERKRAEASRRASEETVRAIIDNLNDGIITINETGEIETFNPAAERTFDYTKEEVIGRNVSLLMTKTDRDNHNRYMTNFNESGVAKIIGAGRELTAQRKDGTEFPVFISVTEMKDPDWYLEERRRAPRQRFIGTIQDLTEKKQVEMTLRRSQKMEAVGKLSGGIAHDFNNLLSIVIGNLDFLTHLTKNDSKLLEPVTSALNAALRGGRLTERMLSFSQQSQAMVEATDINTVLDGMSDIITKSLTAEVTINFEQAGDLWLCDIDSGELEDALLNLSLNARDAMPKGGTFTITTSNVTLDENYVRLHPDVVPGDYVEISATDTGTGIAADIIEKVFDPFFSTKEAGKGTGLGLSMVYGFTQRSKGHLDVKTEPDQGTTFHLYLPRSQRQPAPQPLAMNTEQAPAGGSETILVVDDEKNLAELTRKNLQDLGYTVFVAYGADEAMEVLNNGNAIDLLFTDVVMPGDRNGYDLARDAAGIDPALKILVTSGFSRKPEGDDGLMELFENMVRKPYRSHDLAKKIRQTLDTP